MDSGGRVLLVHPIYKDTWDIPGGYVERGESPAAACRREVAEELGLDVEPRALLSVDWAPNGGEGDKLLFVFDCGPLDDRERDIALDPSELGEWRWVPAERFETFLIPRLVHRLRSTAEASRFVYLEHGKPAVTDGRGPTQ
jgi:8-oxo-dGTP pyrophosphatase MutT (NUDIX family)